MPQPTQNAVHASRPLTNISTAYIQEAAKFITPSLYPIVRVEKQSDKYWTYPKGAWARAGMKPRGDGEESAGTGWSVLSNDTYYCQNYALHTDIGDQTRANADAPLDMDADAAEFLTQQFLISRDLSWAQKHFKSGVWSVDADVTSGTYGNGRWSSANSTPIEDLRKQILAQKKRTAGFKPNKLVLGAEVWNVLVDHAEFLDRINGGATTQMPAMVLKQHLAAILEIDEVVIAEAVYNSADEGAADSFNFICGKSALLLYVNPRPGIKKPSAGYTFVWNTYGSGFDGNVISKYRMDLKKADRVEIEANWDFKQIGSDLGTFFPSVVA